MRDETGRWLQVNNLNKDVSSALNHKNKKKGQTTKTITSSIHLNRNRTVASSTEILIDIFAPLAVALALFNWS